MSCSKFWSRPTDVNPTLLSPQYSSSCFVSVMRRLYRPLFSKVLASSVAGVHSLLYPLIISSIFLPPSWQPLTGNSCKHYGNLTSLGGPGVFVVSTSKINAFTALHLKLHLFHIFLNRESIVNLVIYLFK